MRIKFILPALEEAKSPFWRPIKYSLFPPLGLATLAACCGADDEITLADEHVEELELEDDPQLVCIETYITNARRSYALADHYRARGAYVAMGGLHATTLPAEALAHCDTVLLGPGERAFPRFLADLRAGRAMRRYCDGEFDLSATPLPRRDLFRREKYFVPNSMTISRGCPNRCDFCYVGSFFPPGKSFYAMKIDRILAELETMPGRHLYFLDDNLFADKRLCRDLFTELRGRGKLFQGAVTVPGVLDGDLIELARDAGFRSAFIGFESTRRESLVSAGKGVNVDRDYGAAIRRLDELGILINGSFIFGLEEDGPEVFGDTARWAVDQGITTATFHILTPYPGTAVYKNMERAGRITCRDWDRYDTRHLVFDHPRLSAREMEEGYRRAYKTFYQWGNIAAGAGRHEKLRMRAKHFFYSGAWKKCEPMWNFIIKAGLLGRARAGLEAVLR